MDFTTARFKGHLIVCQHTWEAFGDAAHLQRQWDRGG
jgi:hypothetical protein